MSPKRFSRHVANRFPVPARPVLALLAVVVAIAVLPATAASIEGPYIATSDAAPLEEEGLSESSSATAADLEPAALIQDSTVILCGFCDPDPVAVDAATNCTVRCRNTAYGAPNGAPQGPITVSLSLGSGMTTGGSYSTDGNDLVYSFYYIPDDVMTGSHSFSITYNSSDTSKWDNSSGSCSVGVRLPSSTTITSDSPDPSDLGESYSVNATVTGGAGTPWGTVTVSDSSGATCTIWLLGGSGNCNLTPNSAGATTITAIYNGDSNYASSSDTEPHFVNKLTTTTTLTTAPNPSTFGQEVTFTATVTVDPPGSGTPTGTVTFKDGAAAIGTGTLNASGVATFTTCTLNAGIHSVTAEYGGDANFNGSTSAPLTQVVGEAEVTVTLESAPSPSVFGQTVTLTATVASAPCADFPVTPTGVVFFNDRGVTIGTAALNASGVATMTTFSLVAGPHPLTAVYAGDENYKALESAPLTQTVNRRPVSSVTLVSSANASVFGQTVTFTATVTSGIVFTPTGQVVFRDAGTYIGSATIGGSGRGVFATAGLGVGSHPLTADYLGDQNFLPGSGSLAQTVDKADTTTGITHSSSNPSVYGESVTFTAVVSPTLPGAGTPTGNVVFKVDGAAVFTGALGFTNPGEARWVTTPGDSTELDTAPGDRVRDITAEYSGDGNFNTSASAVFTQTVNKADTTVQLQIPLAETQFGQDVRMTAHVSVDQPGAGTPTGTVTFTVDVPGPDIVMTGTLDGTSVTVVTNTIPVGTWNVQAEYGGDDHFNGDTSAAVSHKVNKTDSETTLESSANPSDFGQSVTFTATVEAAGIGLFAPTSPTGTVTFTLGTVAVVTRTLDASGVATVVTNTLPAGEHEITAEYGGDSYFESSDDSLRQTVNTIATTTEFSGPSSSAIGDSVTFTATVSETLSGDPVTDGDVTFYDGVKELATVTLNGSGQATYNTSSLSAGLHPLKAVYKGTANFQPSTSQRLYHTVGAVGSTTTLTRSPASPTVFGQTVTFTATVTGSGGTPTGQVTFKDGAATIGSDTLDGAGQATLSTSTLAVGTHPIKAVYGGDGSFAGSPSSTVNQVVNKANTAVAVSSSDDTSVFGQTVVFTAIVTVDEAVPTPGAGTPTGTVQFKANGSAIGSPVPLSGGSANVSTSSLPVGTHTITAEYTNYDGNFEDNTGTMSPNQVVSKANTTTTVTSSPSPSVRDQEVTITALVTANSPSTSTPTGGNVMFDFDDGSPTASVPLVNGSASTSHPFASVGSFNVTATYSGNSNFNGSGGSTTHNVNPTPADLSVTKTDSPDPVNVGDNLTYVINVTNNEKDPVNVTLTDTLPPQVSFVSATGGCTHDSSALGGVVTCDLGSLAASGGSASVTIIVKVPLTTPAGTVLRNTAQAGAHSDTEETTVYRSPRRGDCNGDYAVDLADVWAIVRDIFDPTFQGTTGCDANKDRQVDAGDVPSTVLIMLNGLNAGGRGGDLNTATEGPVPSLAEGPALTLPDQVPAVPGGLVTLPVSFAANGHSITSLAFSVDYDETWLALDPADRDGNGIPDTVIFSLPGDFTYSVTFDGDDADGEVDIFIGDITPPLTSLSDGPIVFMILNVDSSPGRTQGAVRFSLDPLASFGDTSGQSVPGTATPTTRQYQIYLPVAFR